MPEFLEHGLTNPALAAVTVQNLPAPNKNTLQLLLETFHRLSGNAVSLCYKDLPTSTTMAPMQLLKLCNTCRLFLEPPHALPYGRASAMLEPVLPGAWRCKRCPDEPISKLDPF